MPLRLLLTIRLPNVRPAALELGPSGLAYSASSDTLYVASSTDNAVYKVPTATTNHSTVPASLFFSDPTHLHGPLDLAILPNGHFVVPNSDGSNVDPNQPSELVEYTTAGAFLNQCPSTPTMAERLVWLPTICDGESSGRRRRRQHQPTQYLDNRRALKIMSAHIFTGYPWINRPERNASLGTLRESNV